MTHARIALISVVMAALTGCGTPEPLPEDSTVTWHRDALPIIQERCQSCHLEGSVSGLDLTKYETARDNAHAISAYVQTGVMPPWLPDESCQPNRNARRLTQEEIDTLVKWAEGGALEGDVNGAPEARAPQLGLARYDVQLDIGVDYLPNDDRPDDYRCFIVDPKNNGDRQVTGFEVLPDKADLLHHVLLYKTSRSEAQALDDAEPGPGYKCFGGPKTEIAIAMGAWAPGGTPTVYPGGTGIPLWNDEVVILQIHYNMDSAAPRPDRTGLRLQYAERPVTSALLLPLVNHNFAIPPRSTGYSVQTGEPVPFDAKIWGLAPHMHKLGRKISVRSNDTCLVDIPKWDFSWQQFYLFEAKGGVPLEGGAEITIRCEWDNPTDATVVWGEGTSDEMCLAFIYLTP